MNGQENISRETHLNNCHYIQECALKMLHAMAYEDRKREYDKISVMLEAVRYYDVVDKKA